MQRSGWKQTAQRSPTRRPLLRSAPGPTNRLVSPLSSQVHVGIFRPHDGRCASGAWLGYHFPAMAEDEDVLSELDKVGLLNFFVDLRDLMLRTVRYLEERIPEPLLAGVPLRAAWDELTRREAFRQASEAITSGEYDGRLVEQGLSDSQLASSLHCSIVIFKRCVGPGSATEHRRAHRSRAPSAGACAPPGCSGRWDRSVIASITAWPSRSSGPCSSSCSIATTGRRATSWPRQSSGTSMPSTTRAAGTPRAATSARRSSSLATPSAAMRHGHVSQPVRQNGATSEMPPFPSGGQGGGRTPREVLRPVTKWGKRSDDDSHVVTARDFCEYAQTQRRE